MGLSNGGQGKLFVCLFWIGQLGFREKMYGLIFLLMNADPRGGLGPKVSAFKLGRIFGDYLPCLKGFKPFFKSK